MPRTRSLAWSELKIGVLTITAIVIASVLVFTLTGSKGFFWQRYTLKTRFPNVAGLAAGSPVRVAGVQVGSVKEIRFAGEQLDVVFEVNKNVQERITDKSIAFLGSVSLLGSSAVDITPSATGTPVPEYGYVPQGRAKGQFADIAEQASGTIEEVTGLVRDLRQGKGSAGKLISDDRLYLELQQFAATAGQMTRELQQGRGTMGKLLKDGFIASTRITQLEAIVADYGVKLAERHSEMARAEQRLLDIDLRLRAIESEYRQQASDQLKITASRLQEIEQELRKSSDASSRQVIVAPADGEVIGLKFSSPGAVIPPRETIADIVPANPKLVIEARLRTEDINRVHAGQIADIRFTAFMSRTTKLVEGRVLYVSGDRIVDREANQAYYTAQIEADAKSLADAGDLKLLAGMPAEVYLKGEQRTPLQYLLEPITQVLDRSARER